ncbi:MAG: hypothetical protein ABI051_15260 [Vicinamibacterales bacterium]
MGLYFYRLLGAASLDASMYEGIEGDRTVTSQAALTVVLSSLATGIGATAWFGFRPGVLVVTAALALLTWAAWAVLMFQIGSHVLPTAETDTNLGELLRTTGFATAPGMLQVLALLPPVAVPVFVVTTAWIFGAMVIAVRHALDYRSTARAAAVCALGAGLCLAVAVGLGLLFSRTAS